MRDKPYGLERFCICLEGVVVYIRPNVEMCLTRGSENGNSGMQLYSAMYLDRNYDGFVHIG